MGKRNREDSPRLSKYTVVVTCVLLKKGNDGKKRALILKRSSKEKEGPGLWTIPGGRLKVCDWGSGIRLHNTSRNHKRVWMNILSRAIRREIREEAGIRVPKVILFQGREKVFLRKDKTPTLILVFQACVPSKTRARTGKESTGFCWVTENELERYDFIGNVKSDLVAAFRSCKKL
ncbi:MAG: NUDIX domain-containing protein [Candidatus Sungbacteria bacterium]|nr:NUDIX domain-containing protein [Candidatus Sungbacteria bacterium]